MENRNAFSLVELSIVIIIIGLIVVGIVGGKSLIETAKNRDFLNEMENWKRATYVFRLATGRLPGDLNEDGITGLCFGLGCPGVSTSSDYSVSQTYPTGSFPLPYNNVVISAYSAPYVDLYLEKLIDFKPAENGGSVAGVNQPYVKSFKEAYHYAFYHFEDYTTLVAHHFANIQPGSNFVRLYADYKTARPLIKPYKYVDNKIDDGVPNAGITRANCSSSTYNTTLNNSSGYCDSFLYSID